MPEDTFQEKSATTDSCVHYLENSILLHNIKAIAQFFTIVDVSHLEQVLGKEHPFIEALYESLYKRYFSNIAKVAGVPMKVHFKNTAINILNMLKKQKNISVSPYSFFEAADGKRKLLLQGGAWYIDSVHHWLRAIQYSYHLNIEIVAEHDEEKIKMINTIASFFSFIKDYDSLGKLVEKYKEVLVQKSISSFDDTKKAFSYSEIKNFFYITSGDLKKVKDLLKEELVPKSQLCSEIYGLAFAEAAGNGYLEIVNFLLKEYPVGQISAEDKAMALWAASSQGHLEVVRVLLEYSDKQPIREKDKEQALCDAISRGHVDIMAFLLKEHLAEKGVVEEKQWALRFAAESGRLDVVQFLRDHPVEQAIAEQAKSLAFTAKRK